MVKTGAGDEELTNKVLLDTGATNYSFMSVDFVKKCYLTKHSLRNKLYTMSVHGGEENSHYTMTDIAIRHLGKSITLKNTKFIILQRCPYDIVIGLNDIRQHDLTSHFRAFFKTQEECNNTPQVMSLSTGGAPNTAVDVPVNGEMARPKPEPTQTENNLVPIRRAGARTVYPSSLFLDPTDQTDQIDELTEENPWSRYFNDSIANRSSQATTKQPPEDPNNEKPPLWDFIIEGTETNKILLRSFLESHRDVFATAVKPTPASVTPFAFDIDIQGWNAEKANKARPRPQTAAKNAAIEKFLKQAIADNVIAPSDAPAWSQVLLTPKPNGKWRFCLDYRILNKYTKTRGWPIPNIEETLTRIGAFKPKYFCVMDCTSGYHQMPIEEQCQKYTTFTTTFGNYKWLRTPMGPKNRSISVPESHGN